MAKEKSYTDMINAVAAISRMVKPFEDAEETLREIQKLERQVPDLQTKRDELLKEAEGLAKQNKDAKDELATFLKKAGEEKDKALKETEAVVRAKTKSKDDEIAAKELRIRALKTDVAGLEEQFRKSKAKKQAELSDLEAKLVMARKAHTDFVAQVTA